jgi:hypothetical protein
MQHLNAELTPNLLPRGAELEYTCHIEAEARKRINMLGVERTRGFNAGRYRQLRLSKNSSFDEAENKKCH